MGVPEPLQPSPGVACLSGPSVVAGAGIGCPDKPGNDEGGGSLAHLSLGDGLPLKHAEQLVEFRY
jgi:hypothetical protein